MLIRIATLSALLIPLSLAQNKIADISKTNQQIQVKKSSILDNAIPIPDLQKIILGYLNSWESRTIDLGPEKGDQPFYGFDLIRIYTIVHSPCGQYIASGSSDTKIKILNVITRTCIATLSGHKNAICQLVYSPCGNFLASASGDNTIKIWRNQAWQMRNMVNKTAHMNSALLDAVHVKNLQNIILNYLDIWQCDTLFGHESSVYALSYSPCGKFIASGSFDKTIKIWNAETGHCLKTLKNLHDVGTVIYTNCGNFIISSSYGEKAIKKWNIATGICVDSHNEHSLVACSPCRTSIVCQQYDRFLRIANIAPDLGFKIISESTDLISGAAYSPCGKNIISGSQANPDIDDTQNMVKIWDPGTGKSLKVLPTPAGASSVSYSPCGNSFAAGLASNKIIIWKNQAREIEAADNSAEQKYHLPTSNHLRFSSLIKCELLARIHPSTSSG